MGDDELTIFCLASGSSGNALLVRAGGSSLLVDAGLGMRTLKAALVERGVEPTTLGGILLTHEHIDHVRGAVPFARRYGVPLLSTHGTLAALFQQEGRESEARPLRFTDGEVGVGAFGVRALPACHDAADPIGFRVTYRDQAIAYTTDTGTVTPEFRAACVGASLIAIESNHDIMRLRLGPYPEALKERILGRNGHLSNREACDLILQHTSEHGAACYWLSHLSEANNTPRIALNYWKSRYQAAGYRTSPAAVEVALRDRPSLVYRARTRTVQLALF